MKSRLRTIGWCLVVLIGSPFAWADDSLKSIPFEVDKDYSHLTTLPGPATDPKQDRCAELAKQMKALKGKPQRRYAVSQQYEADCKR